MEALLIIALPSLSVQSIMKSSLIGAGEGGLFSVLAEARHVD